jgi:hypothetical protein
MKGAAPVVGAVPVVVDKAVEATGVSRGGGGVTDPVVGLLDV